MRKRSPGLKANDTWVLKDPFEFVRSISCTMCSKVCIPTHKRGGQSISRRQLVRFSALKDFNRRSGFVTTECEGSACLGRLPALSLVPCHLARLPLPPLPRVHLGPRKA